MGDMGEYWKDVRALNRKNGESELFTRGVPFLKKNDGAHLIVMPDSEKRVDYWPGTGLWRQTKGNREGRGIASLLRHLGVDAQRHIR